MSRHVQDPVTRAVRDDGWTRKILERPSRYPDEAQLPPVADQDGVDIANPENPCPAILPPRVGFIWRSNLPLYDTTHFVFLAPPPAVYVPHTPDLVLVDHSELQLEIGVKGDISMSASTRLRDAQAQYRMRINH